MAEPITDPIDAVEVAHLVDDAAQHQPDESGTECRHCGAVWPCTKGGLSMAVEQARAERDAANAQAARLVEENRQADGAAIDLAERLDKATAEADALRGDVREAERQRDAMAAARVEAIRRVPALREQVRALAPLRPAVGASTDEEAMATLIVVASDTRQLWLQEKKRTAELAQALNLSRLAAEGWEKRAAELRAIVTDAIAQLESSQGSPIPARFTVRDAIHDLRARLAATDPAAGQ